MIDFSSVCVKSIALAAVLAMAGCQTVDFSNYIPQRDTEGVGQSFSTPNTSRRASANTRRQTEPEYIPSTDELMDIDGTAVEAFLGAPSLRRAEQTSEVWQFATDTCVLFLFFYPNETGDVRVSYLTSSGAHQGQQTPGDQACVEAVTRTAANAVPSS